MDLFRPSCGLLSDVLNLCQASYTALLHFEEIVFVLPVCKPVVTCYWIDDTCTVSSGSFIRSNIVASVILVSVIIWLPAVVFVYLKVSWAVSSGDTSTHSLTLFSHAHKLSHFTHKQRNI